MQAIADGAGELSQKAPTSAGARKLALHPVRAFTCAASSEVQARFRSRSVFSSARTWSSIGSDSNPGNAEDVAAFGGVGVGGGRRQTTRPVESGRRVVVSLGGPCPYVVVAARAASVQRTFSRVVREPRVNRTKPGTRGKEIAAAPWRSLAPGGRASARAARVAGYGLEFGRATGGIYRRYTVVQPGDALEFRGRRLRFRTACENNQSIRSSGACRAVRVCATRR